MQIAVCHDSLHRRWSDAKLNIAVAVNAPEGLKHIRGVLTRL